MCTKVDPRLTAEVIKAREAVELLASDLGSAASPGWQRWIATKVIECEINGLTNFGGSDVYLWWLAKQVREQGWDHIRVTSYVEMRYAERTAERCVG